MRSRIRCSGLMSVPSQLRERVDADLHRQSVGDCPHALGKGRGERRAASAARGRRLVLARDGGRTGVRRPAGAARDRGRDRTRRRGRGRRGPARGRHAGQDPLRRAQLPGARGRARRGGAGPPAALPQVAHLPDRAIRGHTAATGVVRGGLGERAGAGDRRARPPRQSPRMPAASCSATPWPTT